MRDRAPPLCTTFLMTHYKMHQVTFSFNEELDMAGVSCDHLIILGGRGA